MIYKILRRKSITNSSDQLPIKYTLIHWAWKGLICLMMRNSLQIWLEFRNITYLGRKNRVSTEMDLKNNSLKSKTKSSLQRLPIFFLKLWSRKGKDWVICEISSERVHKQRKIAKLVECFTIMWKREQTEIILNKLLN